MNAAERTMATYGFGEVDHLMRKEFYIWEETKERWRNEGWNGDEACFLYDDDKGLGWHDGIIRQPSFVDSTMYPSFEEKIVEITGKYEYVRMDNGEIRMYPIGKREGVMPVFAKAAVTNREDWLKTFKPRFDPQTPERWINFENKLSEIEKHVNSGDALFSYNSRAGYEFLRGLLGPEGLLYAFYDEPDMIHDMMETWLKLSVETAVRVYDRLPFFRIFLNEDISFKTGPLISPKMFQEFLMPYYIEFIQAIQSRRKGTLFVEVDTDGNPDVLLPLYIKCGATAWSPCEVAASCDPVDMARRYPELVILGGIDKRILAAGKDDIRRELDRIIPVMKERKGYVPTCDHGVPPDVSFENYLFYREYVTSID
jgi:uroporphyrinogen decarboxylase